MSKLFKDSFKEHKTEVQNIIHQQNNKIDQYKMETDAQILTTTAMVDQLQGQVIALEQRPASQSDEDNALAKLWALEKALIIQNEGCIMLTNMYDSKERPMPDISRKTMIDQVLKKLNLKADVTHVVQDGKIQQFTKIRFVQKDSAEKFQKEWIKIAPKNGTGAPIYAKNDIPQEVRKLRQPMLDAERALKAHFKKKDEKHKVRIYYHKHTLKVDDVVVAKRRSDCAVVWVNAELQAELDTFMG